ncbi:MAG TPA: OsmC family protein [Acidimicrobiales bacterium]|nr:OsmC family protein [Acidimicrobiales bacterium]
MDRADVTTEPHLHTYRSTVSWSGSTGAGYEAYDRTHRATCPPADLELAVSADPTFRGDPTRVNPEQLLLQAAVSCQLLSFLAVAARARIDVVGYHDDATALMPEHPRPARITRIDLRPHITIRGDVEPARIEHLVEVAHRECFIANTLACEMTIEPVIERVG